MISLKRTMLFIPGNNPSMLMNSVVFGSDCVIFDLEDAVSEKQKDAARILVRNALKTLNFENIEVFVRINDISTKYWKHDLEEVMKGKMNSILLPKTESPESVQEAQKYIEELEKQYNIEKQITIMPLLETALGIENAFQIAKSSERIEGLFLGAEDLTADLGAKRTKEGKEILYSRSRVVTAAKAANILAIDTPFTDVDDDEGLVNDTIFAKEIGFDGKASISPRHVDIINNIFMPSKEEIIYAHKVIDAIEKAEKEGKGVVSLEGKMIDAPIVNRARKVLLILNKSRGVM